MHAASKQLQQAMVRRCEVAPVEAVAHPVLVRVAPPRRGQQKQQKQVPALPPASVLPPRQSFAAALRMLATGYTERRLSKPRGTRQRRHSGGRGAPSNPSSQGEQRRCGMQRKRHMRHRWVSSCTRKPKKAGRSRRRGV